MELKTPLTYGEGADREWYIHDADGNWIAEAVPADHLEADEVARRIMACVNACAGIPNEQLECDNVEFVRIFNERNTLKAELAEAKKDAGRLLHEECEKNDRLNTENAALNDYCAKVEQQRDQLLAALRDCVLVMERDLEGLKVIQQELNGARAAIAAVEPPADHTVERTEMVAEDDGWIEWKGGECPVDGAARVEVKYADGMPGHEIAGSLRWSWIFDGANGGDIVAYRVVQEGDA